MVADEGWDCQHLLGSSPLPTVPRTEIDGMQKTYPPLTLENPQKSTISSGL
jgi:hypothetical protein